MKTHNSKIVYICSPYRGIDRLEREQNILNAKKYGVMALKMGCIPMIVHLSIAEIMDDSDPSQRKLGLNAALELLSICHEIWVFGINPSEGMCGEIMHAIKKGIPIRVFTKEGIEYGKEIVEQILTKVKNKYREET